jgi:hypothetical protein
VRVSTGFVLFPKCSLHRDTARLALLGLGRRPWVVVGSRVGLGVVSARDGLPETQETHAALLVLGRADARRVSVGVVRVLRARARAGGGSVGIVRVVGLGDTAASPHPPRVGHHRASVLRRSVDRRRMRTRARRGRVIVVLVVQPAQLVESAGHDLEC